MPAPTAQAFMEVFTCPGRVLRAVHYATEQPDQPHLRHKDCLVPPAGQGLPGEWLDPDLSQALNTRVTCSSVLTRRGKTTAKKTKFTEDQILSSLKQGKSTLDRRVRTVIKKWYRQGVWRFAPTSGSPATAWWMR
jgi:hypothetical protein